MEIAQGDAGRRGPAQVTEPLRVVLPLATNGPNLVHRDTDEALRECQSCQSLYPCTEVFFPKASGNGLRRTCKECVQARMRRWRLHRRSNVLLSRRDRKKGREKHRWLDFGLTPEGFETLRLQQGGLCAICRQAETVRHGRRLIALTVDHCHITGRVRGLLCVRCNRALGLVRDSSAVLRGIAAYLQTNFLASPVVAAPTRLPREGCFGRGRQPKPGDELRCRGCNRTLAWDAVNFRLNARAVGGLRTTCRDCERVRRKELRLFNVFGLDIHTYERFRTDQHDRCAICREHGRGRWGELHLDHDHTVGAVRGLLCFRCNTTLGLLRDSAGICQAAVAYLEGF